MLAQGSSFPPLDTCEVRDIHVMPGRVFCAHPVRYASDLLGLRSQFRDFVAASTVCPAALGSEGAGPSRLPWFDL